MSGAPPHAALVECLRAAGVHPDAIVAALADRQAGVVGSTQLTAMGVGRPSQSRRASSGRLTRITRGAYVVGRMGVEPLGWLWAAVLTTGGVVSHSSAAWLHRWLERPPSHVHVVAAAGSRSHGRITVHRSRTIIADRDVVEIDGLPVTSVARTLATLPARLVPRAVREAEHQRVFDLTAVQEVLERVPSAGLRAALRDPILLGDSGVNSGGEHDALDLLTTAGLPAPRVNDLVCGLEVDLHWPQQRVIAELDSRRWHGTPRAMEADRRRDARLVAAGYVVLRFTWTQVIHEPDAVVGALRAALARTLR